LPPLINGSVQWSDVEHLFTPYSWLYPSMNAMVDMSSAAGIGKAARAIASLMSMSIDQRLYMPVTRDLDEPAQQRMIQFAKSFQ
jgi:hypothetical protein